MFLLKPARLWCTLLSVIVASAIPTPDTQPPTPDSELHTFKYTPATAPIAAIPAGTPLQFNGSEPGQGDVPGQLGWWIPPVTGSPPIELVSFVQYNKDEGVVFWAERTLFELSVTSFLVVVPSLMFCGGSQVPSTSRNCRWDLCC